LKSKETPLKAGTRFCGTRSDPSLKGSFTNIGSGDLTPGGLSAAVLRGMASELHDLYTQMPAGKQDRTAVGTGNGMRNNPVLRTMCEEIFGMKVLVPSNTEEAACGAALYGGMAADIITEEKRKQMIVYTEARD
ncbi:MAG: hypothetical protein II715_02515, partial [Clostridia bacterium]|nr:hypothetical protein [Clostridia bacterium]